MFIVIPKQIIIIIKHLHNFTYTWIWVHYQQLKLALGLYSALRAWSAIVLRSNLQSKLTVDTIFLAVQTGWLLDYSSEPKLLDVPMHIEAKLEHISI